MSRIRIAFSTVSTEEDALRIARALVEQRLAACVNILPRLRSIYRWNDRIEDEAELLLLVKTTPENIPAVRDALHQLHPYELPEFVVLDPSEVSEAYAEWVEHEGQKLKS